MTGAMRARAPGRPKPGEIPSGDRLSYSTDEGLSATRAPGRPKPGSTLSEGPAMYPSTGVFQ